MIETDVFPAAVQVTGADGRALGTFSRVRVLVNDQDAAVILHEKRGGIETTTLRKAHASGGHLSLEDGTGNTYRVMQMGDCGCQSTLKKLDTKGYLE